MSVAARVVDLRERPDLLPTIADRITAAFWTPADRAWIAAGLREDLAREEKMPCALAAIDGGGAYLGSLVLIPNDCAERLDLTPWLAALWVEEAARERGVGTALIATAVSTARRAGHARLFLAARRGKEPYYARRGFGMVEAEVGRHRLTVMSRDLADRFADPSADPFAAR